MSKQVENLTDAEVKAVYALVTKDAAQKASEKLSVGDHKVDFKLHIHGVLHRGEDYESHKVATANPWLLLAVAFSHLNGVTVESITQEALTADPALVESLKAQAAVAIQAIKGPTLMAENGKVTVDLVAEKA